MEELSAWEQYKKNLGTTRPWHILSGELRVAEDLATSRLDICKACPELIGVTRQCKKCGCLMTLKVKLEGSECPIGKW
ncbi:hypothetical protein UFOVP696_129 [uncultured Caudovirales phage]|jgi:uncharacterized Fe-S radical SAM superfamily protein PflX|uniref:Uncharacterized protein n=1 Tax=uncultured Caudovirales phage TaxID=2100421 RepID=A0A6J5MKC0_9CAUD|nr:hypothetical protein UFOVP429_38 [uncultured Caudovirales phage]CAB4158261.1 hypothetical protein UFOVP696_129 [uncultured Caudovirales phage]